MGLTGLEIYKHLPKKNCGKCGPPTCLAFAMSLAAGKASLDSCPDVTDAAKEALGAASAPPIAAIKFGFGDYVNKLGEETVIFRHEKTFVNPTSVVVEIPDTLRGAQLDEKMADVNFVFERVGLQYNLNGVAIRNVSGDAETFAEAARLVTEKTRHGLVLISEDVAVMERALADVSRRVPLLYAATADNYEKMIELGKKHSCPVVVRGNGLDATAQLVGKVTAQGCKNLVLDTGNRDLSQTLADYTMIRRLAIKRKFRPLGYPIIAFTTASDPREEMMEASVFVAKYASVVVVKTSKREHLLSLLALRGNIYTDPQKPIQVEPKIYEVGQVTPASPVYVTTNFSLTYFSVEGEVQASRVPAYILPVETDGTSVLTAWAAGKYTADKIAEFIKSSGIADRVQHREVVLPGYVAVLSGKLQEASGWKVVVGPREASGIPAFAKGRYTQGVPA
ncbi:MAG: acetyl-CoA decarbonylase/synthase complex subunit gamma [Firmicutes bacterium]|nr:acetyl-CoA decarbonylase/synthase complex subunit gamma [Bacillota bacterium]MCL5039472.1 acetyl-CoA decarbonylase/synthase complex subunit gamma [Bacillota bacterium]